MAQFAIKRKLTDVTESAVKVKGPYIGAEEGPNFGDQILNFNRGQGNVAIAEMTSDQDYEVLILLEGERGGKVEFEIKLAGSNIDYISSGSVTIPMDAQNRSPAFGYVYATAIQITAP